MKNNNIIKYLFIFCILVVILMQSGCNSLFGTKVKPEPVSFNHPDEFVEGDGFMVLADRRIFTLMAFLNAVGFDKEANGQKMHPVRLKVRELVAANLAEHPKKVKKWKKYRYSLTRQYLEPFSFQNFVLSLSSDYPFRQIRPDKELGYSFTGWMLDKFPDILNDFWETAKLDEVWEQVKPDYIKEMHRYKLAQMQEQMNFLWEYLGMERGDGFTIVNVPNLLDRHYHASGARYENYYYTIEGPGTTGYGLNTHEYLHSIVNGLVKENFNQQKKKLMKYYNAGKNTSAARVYQEPVTFTYECLVIALDHRISLKLSSDPSLPGRFESKLADKTKQGLNLTLPFYKLLEDYEKSGLPFDQFLPKMLELLPEYKS